MAMTPDTQVRAQSLKAASFVGGSQQICKSIGRHGTATSLRHGGSSGATSAALLSIYDTWWHQQWHLGLSILFFFKYLESWEKNTSTKPVGVSKGPQKCPANTSMAWFHGPSVWLSSCEAQAPPCRAIGCIPNSLARRNVGNVPI